jgi:hypothetical protein
MATVYKIPGGAVYVDTTRRTPTIDTAAQAAADYASLFGRAPSTVPRKAAARPVWDPSEGRAGFRELADWEVAPEVRKAAQTMVEIAAKDLGLPPITVHWYDDDAGADRGFTCYVRPRAIWLRKTNHYREAMRTAAHECRHLKQYKRGLKTSAGSLRASIEADADQFAEKMMERFL